MRNVVFTRENDIFAQTVIAQNDVLNQNNNFPTNDML